ncbi:MAG: tRNA pseudouridine(13) synthase TruD [Candidatus Woesearchaeota archaeon]
MYQIKQLPEDFIVKEINELDLAGKGNYFYYKLKKKNWNTLDIIKEISRRLRIPLKDIGFAGNKDKIAITEQVISLKYKKIQDLNIKDVSLEYLGQHDQPLTLGDLRGNCFEITVRGLNDLEFNLPQQIINYFDEQRFGSNNTAVGKSIIKKDFREACVLLNLGVENNDYVGALKSIPPRLLRLYVNAYQSHLWNKTVEMALDSGLKIKEVPLLGFATDLTAYPQIQKIIEELMQKEKVILSDFIIRQIPQLSQEGESRTVFAEVIDFKVLEKGEDELNPGKKKTTVSFSLGKGSYATRVIKEIFS